MNLLIFLDERFFFEEEEADAVNPGEGMKDSDDDRPLGKLSKLILSARIKSVKKAKEKFICKFCDTALCSIVSSKKVVFVLSVGRRTYSRAQCTNIRKKRMRRTWSR